MISIAPKEAAKRLEDLLEDAARGEEVIIEREDGRHFRRVCPRKCEGWRKCLREPLKRGRAVG